VPVKLLTDGLVVVVETEPQQNAATVTARCQAVVARVTGDAGEHVLVCQPVPANTSTTVNLFTYTALGKPGSLYIMLCSEITFS